MKNLRTPRRIERVAMHAAKIADCLFEPDIDCSSDYNTSKPVLLLYLNNYSVILLNRRPYINGQLLVALVRHLHFRIFPRWDGDLNFTRVFEEIRTILEHIDATFDRFFPDFLDLYKKNA